LISHFCDIVNNLTLIFVFLSDQSDTKKSHLRPSVVKPIEFYMAPTSWTNLRRWR